MRCSSCQRWLWAVVWWCAAWAGARLPAVEAFCPFPRATTTLPAPSRPAGVRRRFKSEDPSPLVSGGPNLPSVEGEPAPGVKGVVVPLAASGLDDAASPALVGGASGGSEAWLWRGVMLVLTMVWATNFAVIKLVLDVPGVDVSLYAASRFAVASAVMFPFLLRASSAEVVTRGMECGAWISVGYIGQALGLLTTSADKSAFICSLNVLFVALAVGVMNRRLELRSLAAALVACSGVGLIELGSEVTPAAGDLLSLCQPVGFGMGYIRLEEIMRKYPNDAFAVTASKLAVVALTCLGWASVQAGGSLPDFSPILSSHVALSVILYTGLITTAGAVAIESMAFKRVPATDATVILSSEPLWAALFSFLLVGEEFTSKMAAGAVLIIAACLYNELQPGTHGEGTTDQPSVEERL